MDKGLKGEKYMFKLVINIKNVIKRVIPIEIQLWVKYLKAPYNKREERLEKYVLIDIANSGNIGDNAIAVSEIDFIKKNISQSVSYFNGNDFFNNIKWIKKNITENHVILLNGGGNVGVPYVYNEIIREVACVIFKKNKIVMFPQTVDFGDLSILCNRVMLKNAQTVYGRHSNLTLCAREKKSYELMMEYFPKNKVLLTPDIVLRYMPQLKSKIERNQNKVYLCVRNDVEKAITHDQVNKIEVNLKKWGYSVEYTDTYIGEYIVESIEEARSMVNSKISEFRSAGLVITDRLHGMVFSYLAKTPCIVISNYNHKVKGVYEWIKNCGYVYYAENADYVLKIAGEILEKKHEKLDDKNSDDWDRMFSELIENIR